MIWKTIILIWIAAILPSFAAAVTATNAVAAYDVSRNLTLQWNASLPHPEKSNYYLSVVNMNWKSCNAVYAIWCQKYGCASVPGYGSIGYFPNFGAGAHTDKVNFRCMATSNAAGIAYNRIREYISGYAHDVYLKQYAFNSASYPITPATAAKWQPATITVTTPRIYLQTAIQAVAVTVYNGTNKLPVAPSWKADITTVGTIYSKYALPYTTAEVQTKNTGADYQKYAYATFTINMPELDTGTYDVIAAFASTSSNGMHYQTGVVAQLMVGNVTLPSAPAAAPDLLGTIDSLLQGIYNFLKTAALAAIYIPGIPPL